MTESTPSPKILGVTYHTRVLGLPQIRPSIGDHVEFRVSRVSEQDYLPAGVQLDVDLTFVGPSRIDTSVINVDAHDGVSPILRLGGASDSSVDVCLCVSTFDGEPVVQIDTGDGAVRINVNDGELATIRHGGDEVELPEHSHEFQHRRSESADEELTLARKHLNTALRRHETAVLRRVSQLVREAYPTAASIKYDGEENEMGLLHVYVRAILDGDSNVLDSQDNLGSWIWGELIDEKIEPLLWKVSEHDQSYYGEGKTLDLMEV